MPSPLRIFLVDFVPLSNKGEEAILRGIEDMLGRGRPVELGVLGPVSRVTQQGNITVFPGQWMLRVMGQELPGRVRRNRIVRQLVEQNLGRYGPLNHLTRSRNPNHAALRDYLDRADVVLVGHDGVFGVETCGIIHVIRGYGRNVGVLGSGLTRFGSRAMNALVGRLYRRASREAAFCVFRERRAADFMRRVGADRAKIRLEPDPAFAMRPAPKDEIERFLGRQEWYARARDAGRLLVGATVCHKDVLLRRPFGGASTSDVERRRQHTQYLAEVFDRVIADSNAFVVFVPHSLEPGRDDLKAAQGVVERMASPSGTRHVMTDDLSARTFKGLFAACDFVIGQRAHSMIGSASVATPMVGLVASNDYRTHDIIGDMAGCEEQLIDMDRHDSRRAAAKIVRHLENRLAIREHLTRRMTDFRLRLNDVADMVLATKF